MMPHARQDGLRLTLVIASLAPGGAERVMATMANHWAERGRQITLITLGSTAMDYQRLCAGGIRRISLDVMGPSSSLFQALRNNCRRLGRLSKAISNSRPDAVISFMADVNILTLAATTRRNVPVIVAERTNPMVHKIDPVWTLMRRLLYRRASAIVVQSPEVHAWATTLVAQERVYTIPNAVMASDPEDVSGDSTTSHLSAWINSAPNVLAMGRLSPEKGFDVLLRAFARCHARQPGWSLVILGEGPERSRLRAIARELGIEAAVKMPGYVRRPEAVLRRADLFVLPSRYEGFPNALLEAMACGLPVIAADCPSGPRHIIRDGVNGLLVKPDDVCGLSDALLYLMEHLGERQRLAGRAIEVADHFSLESVMACWDDVIANALSCADQAGVRQ